MNYHRLRRIMLVPLTLNLLFLVFSLAGFHGPREAVTDVPNVILMIRIAVFAGMIFFLFAWSGKTKAPAASIVLMGWFLLIILRTYSVTDIPLMLILVLELVLLNLFVLSPPVVSISSNTIILVSFILFRFIQFSPVEAPEVAGSESVFGGGGSSIAGSSPGSDVLTLLPAFIAFMVLIAVVSFLSRYQFRDIIRQIYLRKITVDQLATIKAQNAELERLHRMRDDVDRIVRHDLRSPLNGILGATQLLKGGSVEDQRDEFVSIIEQSGYKMLHMINNSLDLYQMAEGTYLLELEDVNLTTLLEEVRNEMLSLTGLKNVDMQFHFTPSAATNARADAGHREVYVQGERVKLANMMSNLVKNAVEASPEDETVTVSVDSSRRDSVTIDIHNMGAVPVQMRDSFFERYATAGKKGGTGLGTYSAKLIADTHGGDLSFTTSERDGTHLTVTLPRVTSVTAARR
ncbi:sensor histidine kinase [Alkalispirochaeta americana]|nr:HAMP domain-containing sensor histidine kinase [Alkalispirochaeta americana]